jgi:hypothetical protein
MDLITKALGLAEFADKHDSGDPMAIATVYALAAICGQLESIDDALRNTIGGSPRA